MKNITFRLCSVYAWFMLCLSFFGSGYIRPDTFRLCSAHVPSIFVLFQFWFYSIWYFLAVFRLQFCSIIFSLCYALACSGHLAPGLSEGLKRGKTGRCRGDLWRWWWWWHSLMSNPNDGVREVWRQGAKTITIHRCVPGQGVGCDDDDDADDDGNAMAVWQQWWLISWLNRVGSKVDTKWYVAAA